MDVVVIGGGPAGYAAAIALAQGGARVRLVEEAAPGGTCVHRGCIPTKALLESARLAREMGAAEAFGLRAPAGPMADWTAVRRRQDRIVAGLASGLGQLLRASGVTVVRGRGTLLPPDAPGRPPRVRVEPGMDRGAPADAGDSPLRPDVLVLAPGSVPARPPIPGADLPGVIDSDGLLALEEQPRRLAIVGGGAIGCELATAHAALGADVAVLEAMPHLLPAADADIARRLEAAFRRRGIAVATAVAVLAIEAAGRGAGEAADSGRLAVRVREAGGAEVVHRADAVLLATGRRPNTGSMGLAEAGVRLRPGGAIEVDARFRCPGVPGVWAVGDAVGQPMLAHAAFAQASAAAADALGRPVPTLPPVPFPVYSHPEVAWVGASEEAPGARAARVPFGALGRAHAAGDIEGLCKMVADGAGRIVGVHMIGAHATELIAAGVVAVARAMPLEEFAAATLPHPTLTEALEEAAHLLLGRPLHVLPAGRR